MARTVFTITTMTGSYDTDGVTLTSGFIDFDHGNDMELTLVGGEIFLFTNTNATSRAVTLISVNDPFSRTGNLTKTIAQNDIVIFGPMRTTGFKDSSGLLTVDGPGAANDGVEYIVLRP